MTALPDNFLKRAAQYLEQRGIEDFDLIDRRLGLKIQPSGSLFTSLYKQGKYGAHNFSRDNRVAIVIPHYDILGEMIPWWSARLVDAGEASGFMELVQDTRPKMLAPANEPPHAYLCPLCEWTKLEKGQRVYIHESAIKAINGALLGFHSVGLNGVAGYKSTKHGLALVDELKQIPWRELELQPVIVFDNDYETNTNVQLAIQRLSKSLVGVVGAKPAIHVPLPDPEGGGKWGFDDARKALGDDWAREYLQGDGVPVEGSDLDVELAQLNTEVAWVSNLAQVVELETGTLLTRGDFAHGSFANRHALVPGKKEEMRRVKVAPAWIEWEHRLCVPRIEYAPGAPKLTKDYYNCWLGMGCEPLPGETGPIEEFLRNNLPKKHREWFLDWIAYPLQNLGAKMPTAVVLVGRPGTGKSLLAHWISRIYGANAVSIGKEEFESQFNAPYAQKQLVVVDEMHNDGAGTTITNKLKKAITDPAIVVNGKNVRQYEITSRLNFLITTNYADAIKLDSEDRRIAVLEFKPTVEHTHDSEYWARMVAYMDSGGVEALYHYLLSRDLSKFTPTAWAPTTEEKRIMTETTRSPLEAWCHDLLETPDVVLPEAVDGRALFEPRELAMFYSDSDPKSVHGLSAAIGKQLRKAGVEQRTVSFGRTRRFWVIRDRDEPWSHKACVEHLEKFAAQLDSGGQNGKF